MTKADDIGKNAPTTLTERETTVAKAVQAFKDANSAHNKSLYSYILLGKALLKARQVCGANFYGEIKEDMVPKKQIQRYVRFVADESDEKCLETLSKVPAVTDKTNLKLDSKIDEIKESDLDTLKDPSMKKLALMKELDTAKFNAVLGGDDKEYDALADKKKKEQAAKTKIEKEQAEEKLEKEFLNTGMTKKEFEIYKAGGDEAVKKYMEVKAEQKKLEKIISDKNQKLTDLRLEIKTKDKKLKELQPPVKKPKAA